MADTAASMVDDVVDVAEAAADNDVDIVPAAAAAAAAVATYVTDSPTLSCVDDCEVVVVVAASLALELRPSWVYPATEPRQSPVVVVVAAAVAAAAAVTDVRIHSSPTVVVSYISVFDHYQHQCVIE